MGLTPAQRHADDCEILYDRELGECTCYVGEREERARLAARIAALEAALRGARWGHSEVCEVAMAHDHTEGCICGAAEHNAKIDEVLRCGS